MTSIRPKVSALCANHCMCWDVEGRRYVIRCMHCPLKPKALDTLFEDDYMVAQVEMSQKAHKRFCKRKSAPAKKNWNARKPNAR